jgi:hypothetical protein
MKPDDLDRVLAGEPDIVPSSGFVAAVMNAVTADATAPPLSFPWKRAWPFAVGFAALFVWLSFLQFGSQAAASGPDVYGWFKTIVPMATGWVAGGLAMTIALTVWTLRLVRLRWRT